MAQIYDFPRAARAEHGHGAKKVLAGVRFQWTDPKKFLRPRWRAGGRSVPYVPRFFCRASLCQLARFFHHDFQARSLFLLYQSVNRWEQQLLSTAPQAPVDRSR